MRSSTTFALLLSLATLWSCSSQPVTAPALPRVDLLSYSKLGLVEFASDSDATIIAQATREFESHVQAAQPGTRMVALGSRESLLAAVGSRELDAMALRKIGRKYGVDAIFVGNLNYSEPMTEVTKPEGGARAELRGDIAYTLMETRTGDSVWSSSAWALRPRGRVKVSAEQGGSGAMRGASNPREEMVASLVYDLTGDFRPSSVR
ncbi:MAG TPA: hypothetical protein VLJ62_28740 [Burkholderiaceae bacterium]|nr:hypothetical protein [Burkholderiaceae bacterium]